MSFSSITKLFYLSEQLTPLHYACYRGDYQAVKLLIDHRANISVENCIGYNIRK
jgi:ankyrin repeat protein